MNDLSSLTNLLVPVCTCAYGICCLLYLLGRRKAARVTLATAWCVNLAIFALNWVAAGEPPFGNMYHVHVFLGLCFLPLLLALVHLEEMGWAGGYFAFAAALALGGAMCMDSNVHWRRMPALQSYWFVPHVFAYMVSYALATVAFVMTVTRWIRRMDPESAGRYAATARSIIRIGIPFMTFGMLSGALWAEEAWGRYWSWDPKETWSLITWTGYIAYLHCRYDTRTSKWEDTVQTLAFLALIWTFFLVNLMPKLSSTLHSYAH